MADLTPALARTKPSGVRSPVEKARSYGSASLIISVAPLASVRATSIVGTSMTSIARRAATRLRTAVVRRDQHLAAHVAALLLRRELVLEVDARRAGLDHRLHQLEDVERAAEARLGVGHDRAQTSTCRPCLPASGSGRPGAACC